MDRHNNSMGRDIAASGGSCLTDCYLKILSGDLWWLEDGRGSLPEVNP
jgi:hypothetical protein